MFEVHTGTRAGRPIVLLLLTAGALVCALGLAWAQVHRRLALGEPVRIDDSPLIVRPPAGWIQNPRGSGVFIKAVRKTAMGRQVWAAERKIEFHYNDYFSQLSLLFQAAAVSPGRPATIGDWRGAQFVLRRVGQRWEEQVLYRWASAPWGGQISVEYVPLGEASHGDIDLFDAVCDGIELDGSDLLISERDTLSYAGVSFETPADWELLGPQDIRGPGLCLQDATEEPPRWGLALFRRSLDHGRQPTDLLVDEALYVMGAYSRPVERLRSDKAYVVFSRNPDGAPGGSALRSVWVLAESPARTAVVYALAPPRHASLAHEAAGLLVDRVKFVSEFPR